MSRNIVVVALASLALGLWACDDGESTVQGGVDAADSQDSGVTPDAAADTGLPDAGQPDVGLPDAQADIAPDTADDAGPEDAPSPDVAIDAAPDTGPDPESCVILGCDTTQDTTCRTAKCVAETGKCIQTYEPHGKPCNDGDADTENDACKDGVCKGNVATCVCNVNADCKSYDDGNLCNGVYVCVACKCTVDPASIVFCDTSGDDQCNNTVCKPATGTCDMTPVLNGTACDDGDVCSKGDKCTGGACAGTVPTDTCASDEVCVEYDDGDVCNGVWTCQTDGLGCGHCLYAPDTLVVCDTTGLAECQKMECLPESGVCEQQQVFNGAFCKLGNGSTGNCANGTCLAKAPACICDFGADVCDDGDPCTTDTCDGCACTHLIEPTCCTTDQSCSDLDPCTVNRCTPTGCTTEPVVCFETNSSCPSATDVDPLCCDDEQKCDDNLPTTSNACTDHRCTTDPIDCTCSEDAGCDDGDLCTADTCDGCVCAATPIAGCCAADADCDDGDPCTVDACQADSTCAHAPSEDPLCCASSADCEGTLVCWAGTCALKPSCAAGCASAGDCDDGDIWSLDSCTTGPQGCGVCHHIK